MVRARVEIGTKIKRKDCCHLVIDLDANDNVILEELHTARRQSLKRQCLEKELLIGLSVFAEEGLEQGNTKVDPIDMLPLDMDAIVRRRQAYVIEFEKQATGRSLRSVIDLVRTKVAKQISDQDPPSNSSLFRWYRSWRLSEGSLSSLIPEFKNRGSHQYRISPDVVQLIQEEIKKYYWVLERPNLQSIIPHIQARIDRENVERLPDEQLVMPSYTTIFRIERKMDPYARMVGREGKNAADRYYRPVMNSLDVEAPLDLVQIDHTVLDIHVLAPVDGWVARPRLTVALDTYSRMPIGIYVGFISPSYESVMLCLKQAIESKNALLGSFASIKGDWPCYGLPRKILVDNGLEFHSNNLRDVCSELGIGIINHPVREPRYKGAVERFFRSINQGLLTRLKGKTFSNPREKGDYDSIKSAAIPLEVFQEVLYKWIVDVYARRFHKGIEAVPLEMWWEGVKKYPVDLPTSTDELNVLLAERFTRRLTSAGVKLHNAFYNNDQLNSIFLRADAPAVVTIKRDPSDLGHVYVYDDKQCRYITVPCYSAPLQGISLWQYKIVRKRVSQNKKAAEEKYDLSRELQEIWSLIEDQSLEKKRRVNTRVARFTEYEKGKGNEKLDETNPAFEGALMVHEAEEVRHDFEGLIEEARKMGWDGGVSESHQ